MSAFTDVIKLALQNGGKIPATIPDHYLHHVYAIHRTNRGTVIPRLKYSIIRDGVINL